VEARENERWLPDALIRNLADCCAPPLLNKIIPKYLLPVSYLEPVSDVSRGYEVPGWGKAPRLYIPNVMFEHADVAGGATFMLVFHKESKKPLSGLADMASGFAPFGLIVTPLVSPPSQLRQEIDSWLSPRMKEHQQQWFQVTGHVEGLAYLFAVTFYNACRLQELAGARLHTVHIIGEIEGKPNCIRAWVEWSAKVSEAAREH
jgi:hypothetical protein